MKHYIKSENATILQVLAFIAVLIYSRFSLSALLVVLCIWLGIMLEVSLTEKSERPVLRKLLLTVSAVYMITAVFSSMCFEDGELFMMNDPLQYFSRLNITRWPINPSMHVYQCYVMMDDMNRMHELYVNYLILFSNNYLDGASVIYLTLTNVFWGVLAIGAVYRILRKTCESRNAYKYTLAFALLCYFHYYSISFVRDIIITCFYVHIIEMVLSKFKVGNLIFMFASVFVIWGIRLYSGFFVLAFIAYYLFISFSRTRWGRIGAISAGLLIAVFLLPRAVETQAYELSQEEIENYNDYNEDRASSSSLSIKLTKLPPVAREVSLTLFTQIAPFPPFIGTIDSASTLSQLLMALIVVISEFYWYLIAFGLLYMMFILKANKYVTFNEWLFLGLIVLFLLLNVAQLDARRIIGVYPFLLYMYVRCKHVYLNTLSVRKMNTNLSRLYFFLLAVYMLLKL